MTTPSNGGLRASDADRAETATRLRAAVDDGRLTLLDYDERLRDTYAAATHSELAAVTVDLPAPAPVERRRDDARSAWGEEWRAWFGGALIMVAIWLTTSLVSGGFHGFWPAIPLGIWGAVIVAGAVGGCGGKRRARR